MRFSSDSGGARDPSWSAILPVKPLARAKSRLALDVGVRQQLTLAMALDTATAALECPAVGALVVVTDDRRVAEAMRTIGARVTADEPDAGLDAALLHGASIASDYAPGCAVAALAADLPALKSRELLAALQAASQHERCVVADQLGVGTTLLTAREGLALDPHFGENSLRRHVESGAIALDLDDIPGLRLDVDTLDDLRAARELGLGANTATASALLRK